MKYIKEQDLYELLLYHYIMLDALRSEINFENKKISELLYWTEEFTKAAVRLHFELFY